MKVWDSRADITLEHLGDLSQRSVLELGNVGMGDNDVFGGVDNLTHRIKARRYVGVDINQEGAQHLTSQGYHTIVHDLNEPFDLGERFDVVLSEENLEHISNLRTYFSSIRKHLSDDGVLIVTTPNLLCFDFLVQRALFGRLTTNPYHTHGHTVETILYLLETEGFKPFYIEIIQHIHKKTIMRAKLWRQVIRFVPSQYGRTIFLMAKKTGVDR